MLKTGHLYGVGVGPGDPELLTLKAARLIGKARVIAHFAKSGNDSHARRIVSAHLPPGAVELPLLYPVTTELPRHSEAYRAEITRFYDESAERVAAHLNAGEDVVILSEGDPLFYGSYMHLHVRLTHRYRTEVVPGVTGMAGCWATSGIPIAQGDDVLSIIPGTLAEDALTDRFLSSEAVVVMKVGRNLPKIKRALEKAGRLEQALYVERATMPESANMRLSECEDEHAPYFSIILVPGWEGRR